MVYLRGLLTSQPPLFPVALAWRALGDRTHNRLVTVTDAILNLLLGVPQVCPIISITFYMVIIRIGLAESQRSSDFGTGSGLSAAHHQPTSVFTSGGGRAGDQRGQAVPMSRLQVHITKVHETDVATFENEGDTGSETDRDRKTAGLEVRNVV